MNWSTAIKGFKAFLLLERRSSQHTLDAYLDDVSKLSNFFGEDQGPLDLRQSDLQSFIQSIHDLGLKASTQARILSGIRAFYSYLIMERLLEENPTELIEGPKIKRKIPDTLSAEEMNHLLHSIDMSGDHGQRNRAMLETLYACGLRVSELIQLKMSNLYRSEGFVRVIGKNNKERLVPIGSEALHQIELYIQGVRRTMTNIHKDHTDTLFLNRRGKGLSRVMVFLVIKEAVARAGINKNVSPHTFRHSFASHLVEGGADLRAVQEMLGHESITTTEIYTHLDKEFLRETLIQYHPAFRA